MAQGVKVDKSLEHLLGHQSKLVPFTFAHVQFAHSSSNSLPSAGGRTQPETQ